MTTDIAALIAAGPWVMQMTRDHIEGLDLKEAA